MPYHHEKFNAWWDEVMDYFRPAFDPNTTWADVGGLDVVLWGIDEAKRLIAAYDDFNLFREHWKWRRLLVPLQFRLICEQILWDMGLPWRSLITGFRAIEGAAGQTGVSGPASPYPNLNQTPSKPHALPTCPPGYFWHKASQQCLPVDKIGGF